MTVTPTGGPPPLASIPAPLQPSSGPGAGGGFATSLSDLQRRAAARDILSELPPPMALQIVRKPPSEGPPNSAVHELFLGLQRGEQILTEEQADADTLIGATYRATKVFDSPDQMWATMREILGNVTAVGFGVRQALAGTVEATDASGLAAFDALHPATTPGTASAPTPAVPVSGSTPAPSSAATSSEAPTVSDGAPETQPSSRPGAAVEDMAILGGALPRHQVDWWDAVLLLLLPIPRGQPVPSVATSPDVRRPAAEDDA